MDPYLQHILIRAHIAELHREAAQRQPVRQATPAIAQPRRRAFIPTLVRAFSIAWLKHDMEGEALP
jgi:hypothetical protein